ncbi:acetyl-CoA carboxylase biotin carboxylase subunit family protein [Streptomyces scabiei]|uniref:ATP-grasp domain-containing protein n=1 Tax=Streptomyces scabiei TaxID=1930 RepID=UPI0036A7BF1F
MSRAQEGTHLMHPRNATTEPHAESADLDIVVLDTGNPVLADALLARGHRVSFVVPNASADLYGVRYPGVPVHGVSRWDDRDEMRRLARELGSVDVVTTIDEQSVVAAAVLREAVGAPGMGVDDALAYTSKAVAKRRCAAAGVPTAAFRVVRHASEIAGVAEEIGYPLIVKHEAGIGTLNTFTIRGPDDLDRRLAEGAFDVAVDDPLGRFSAGTVARSLHASGGFVVEQYLDVAAEYCCDLYRYVDEESGEEEILVAAVGRYSEPCLRIVGREWHQTFLPPGSREAQEVRAVAVRGVRALGTLTGATHCEILRTKDGRLWFGEAGARPGGAGIWHATNAMYGHDGVAALAAMAVGRRPEIPAAPVHDTVANILVVPEPGVVRSAPTTEEVLGIPGVVDADIRLVVGEPVPAGIGTISAGGRIVYVPRVADEVEAEVAELRQKLGITVERAEGAEF